MTGRAPIGETLRRNRVQIGVMLAVFALFLLKAVGLFDVDFSLEGGTSTLSANVAQTEFLVLAGIGLALSLLLPVLSPINASVLTFLAMLPIFYLGYRVQPYRPLVPMEYSLLTVLMIFVVNVLVSYFTETRRKQQLVEVFGQYVPMQVARAAARDPEHLSMQADAREMTILFCDVHGFTAMAERLDPREVAELLDTLFTPLSAVIHAHHGVIDKYMGDAIMAFWGAPVPDAHHASRALAAAFEMQEAMEPIRREFAARGWPEVRVGIGINTGLVSVGNMGSAYRVAYTVIGDAVNLASRLQDLTRVFRAPVIVGDATRRAFRPLTYRELGLVQVKGKNTLTRIYEPCNPGTDPASTIATDMHRHNEALRLYYERDWTRAEALFRALEAARPDDPLYDYYLRRIAEFRRDPPPADWRGELRFSVG